MLRRHTGEMAAGGKAHDRNFFRIDAIIPGIIPDIPDCPHHIRQRGVVVIGRDAVLQHEGGNAPGHEVFGDVDPFVFVGNGTIAAARADDNAAPGRIPG